MFVYGLKDPDTGKICYVGKTTHPFRRYYGHIYRPGSGNKLWVSSLLENGKFPLWSLLEVTDTHTWRDRERHWISQFQDLHNIDYGGNGYSNFRPRPQYWNKSISDGMKRRYALNRATTGHSRSASTRTRLSISKTKFNKTNGAPSGWKVSKEAIHRMQSSPTWKDKYAKVSKALKGRKKSTETRKNMSLWMRRSTLWRVTDDEWRVTSNKEVALRFGGTARNAASFRSKNKKPQLGRSNRQICTL